MKGSSGLPLVLMLTGLLVPTNTFLPPTSRIPFFERSNKPRRRLEEVTKVQGESLSIEGFCSQQQEKVWCKGDLLGECNPAEPLSRSGPGWKHLTTVPNQRVILQDLRNGCVSFFISALQVEDSGIYWFGILEGLNITPLRKMKVIVQKGFLVPTNTLSPPTPRVPFFEKPSKPRRGLEEVMKIQGESLSIEGFCSQQHLHEDKVWCKGDLLKECNPTEPPSLSGPGWKYLATELNQRIALQDLGNGCASFFMSALQVEDTGIYWFGILDGLNITPLRKIKVTVRKGQQNNSTVTAASENEQRVYQVVLVLVSIAVGITIIAALALVVVTMLLQKKMTEADDLNFGDNPNCRVITLQIHESNATNNSMDKEASPAYAILKQPKSRIEDVTHVNTKFPRSSFIKCSSVLSSSGQCSPGVLSSSGSVKYANIIFGSRVQHIKD
ncbi:uncharacterized protein LOC133387475 [Rhineura floridana]|uniref:uncharacterized protein LOC133387475 n=1 Tax=Rhineura floridana TaxID=261503 RepID=UPI002AC87C77|nr:uncharacterized protein LOC133387475 [Rhineura floridana]